MPCSQRCTVDTLLPVASAISRSVSLRFTRRSRTLPLATSTRTSLIRRRSSGLMPISKHIPGALRDLYGKRSETLTVRVPVRLPLALHKTPEPGRMTL